MKIHETSIFENYNKQYIFIINVAFFHSETIIYFAIYFAIQSREYTARDSCLQKNKQYTGSFFGQREEPKKCHRLSSLPVNGFHTFD